MWIHKRLDISWYEIFISLLNQYLFAESKKISEIIEDNLPKDKYYFISLSVRTGFDLLLKNLAFPPKSEVIVPNINIPDMFRILQENNYKIVPIDIDPFICAPIKEELIKKINENTKIIMFTNLFGAKVNLLRYLDAIPKNIFIIEDSAQYFNGFDDPLYADVRMYSFGTIKTHTCFGGSIFCLKDEKLTRSLKNNYESWFKEPGEKRSGMGTLV